ncbi:Nif3-like dinuclear metal center hexameric protein [Aquitalea magnusonii]|uniref:GTP cyclohydrolase 1 type 2 homolog n=1 Tax=Aquitalea magnusonii TaxID=332411 RepID=A0A318K692_9NEIS|nr:Nif3-like dinuclear metal center hexameric protein [Aquitalea magnusonii]PXX49486.1 dinuclear metal center YbgI/SA1388 family protein [Aquitalea magnusonii]
MQLPQLIASIDEWLEPWRYQDYAPNGLQVEGRAEVRHIITGVTASQALIDVAIARRADAILVHHGYFWKGEDARLVGMKRARVAKLLQHDISLIAYHLPLDGHAELGNNATLAKRLGWQVEGQTGEQGLLWHGRWPAAATAAELAEAISLGLGRQAMLLGPAERPVRRLAWCTGGAQSFFQEAIRLGVDAFVTGEVSEQCFHLANEYGVAFIAAGHHVTERYGVQALGEKVSHLPGITVEFVDLFNPV